MRKLILLVFVLLFTFGCVNIQNLSYEEIIKKGLENDSSPINEYRHGYKYYLPRGLSLEESADFNEKLSTKHNNYYLFIDYVGYHNKKETSYEINDKVYYSQKITHKNEMGFLEIKEDRNKFYVEMMYNYAKIEIVTNREYLNEVIYKSIVLLSSIKYNDVIIDKMLKNEMLSYNDVPYNIFKPKENVSNFLDYDESGGTRNYVDNEVPDYDLIK